MGWPGWLRLIPAGAGQMQVNSREVTWPRAHPRRCGADEHVDSHEFLVRGSSPQVRGRFGWGFAGFQVGGLIPAGAGQIRTQLRGPGNEGAHPRRCGADFYPSLFAYM